MKKKLKIATIFIIAIAFGWFAYANLYPAQNLRRYSVYYAHNMEHKNGTYPELAMVLDNLDLMRKPKKSNIEYRYDGRCIIYNFKYKVDNNVPRLSRTNWSDDTVYCFVDNKYSSYYFDRSFEIKDGFSRTDTTYREIDVNAVDKDAVYHDLHKNFGFLVEANVHRKPLINMQKEFNKKYYKRFN